MNWFENCHISYLLLIPSTVTPYLSHIIHISAKKKKKNWVITRSMTTEVEKRMKNRGTNVFPEG